MGRMSRQKGKRGEREAAAELAEVFGMTYGVDVRRGVQHQGGPDSPDVVLDGVNVHVECKRVERLDLYGAMRQAEADAGSKKPVVWHRRNNEDSVCIIRTKDLARVAREIVACHSMQQVR